MTNDNFFKNLKQKGIPFMEGREKGDIRDLLDKVIHIVDFGFIRGDNGEYAVFITKEDDKNFYCGGMAVTETFRIIKEAGKRNELPAQECKLVEATSKNKRKYISIEF